MPTLLAQSPIPSSANERKTLKIESSSSLDILNQTIKQYFEPKFEGRVVAVLSKDTETALNAVREGSIDLAAIGRDLTRAEKRAGLVALPLPRQKIAIIVGKNSSFRGSLTDKQFAKILRGEITDWAQVGGKPGPIRFIDRPENSEVRRALISYDIFKGKRREAGNNATIVKEDSSSAVVQTLGEDGIGYAIASQIANSPEARVVPMHGTLPEDPRYPFSQPAVYVYRESISNPAVSEFVNFVKSEGSQEAIASNLNSSNTAEETANSDSEETEDTEETEETEDTEGTGDTEDTTLTDNEELNENSIISPGLESTTPLSETEIESSSSETNSDRVAVSPTETARTLSPNADEEQTSPWLWFLLLLGLLAFLLGWLLRQNRSLQPATTPIPTPPREPENTVSSPPVASEINEITTSSPNTSNNLDITRASIVAGAAGAILGGNSSENSSSPPQLTPDETSISSDSPEKFEPVPTQLNPSLSPQPPETSSSIVLPPPKSSTSNESSSLSPSSEELNNENLAIATSPTNPEYQLRLVPDNFYSANVYWENSDLEKLQNRIPQGESIALRLYEVAHLDPPLQLPQNWQHYECDVQAKHWYLSVPHDGDYWAELGYINREVQWICLARSSIVRIGSS
ncbi:MAG: substrate-binding domain-containing protein [Cyanobacteriota bacterium]|nr:substrate-binding domain-containing protein [Cyanobacteriota bacterium]